MKKTTSKITKTRVAKTSSATKATKTAKSAKVTPPATPTHKSTTTSDTPGWVTALAIILIILGYAVYRFWGVAKVNSTTISRLDYYRAMERQVGEQTLENLITEALIAQAGKQNNVVIDQKAIDDQIATISAQLQAQGQTLEQALAAERLTLDEVRRQFALQQIVQALGTGDTSVSAQEIDDYIANNKSSLPTSLSSAELRSMVEKQLQSQKANENIAKWLNDLKSAATIIKY